MAPPDAAPMPAVTGAPFGTGVTLGVRVEMYPSAPLPDFNAAGGPAFAARFKGDAGSELMAILCNSHMPPRHDALASMRNIDHPAIVRLIEGGVVVWPSDGARYFALAYQRPAAPRFKQSIDETHTPLSEDSANHQFLTPLIGALNELLRTGTVHNAIRPTNIFWRPGGAAPQLGECLSTPAGLTQPVLFETLERGMANPVGRGTGTHADDCYAFGVTMALFILGHNPLHGLDDRAIIQSKIERGTFNTLVGNTRLSGSHGELLRGLLTDDARQRWTATELEQWLGGRRLTPKNTEAGRRSSRALEFAGKEYWQVRPLAEAFASHPPEAARIIDNGSLDKWLRRSLGDEERAESVEEAKSGLRDQGKMLHYEDILVSRVCVALDPSAPIRYRGLAVMPAGIGTMMVDAILTGGSLQGLSEIISNQLVTFWVNMQREMKTNLVPLGQQFERVRGLLEKTSFGNGVERAVYELELGLACLSPILRTQYVTTPKTLMSALERMAGAPNRAREPMDRHIAAFLIVREKRSEALFESMTAPEASPRRGIALLTLFSELQYRYGPEMLPNLSQWLMPLIDISVRRYLGKAQREKVQKQVREAATRGNLATLLRLVDDPERVEQDRQQFLAARLLYLSTLKEINLIEARLANRESVVHSEGKPIAASVSGFLAVLFGLLAVLRVLWQNV
jgi:hypothetical protein